MGMKKYVAPGSEFSDDCVILLKRTPTSVACVVCGVQAAAKGRTASNAISFFMIASLSPRQLADVGRIFADVNRPFDAVENRQPLAQAQQLVGTGTFHGAIDVLGALRFGALDEQIGLGMFRALVEIALRIESGDLRLKLSAADVDRILSLSRSLFQSRIDLGLLRQRPVRQH